MNYLTIGVHGERGTTVEDRHRRRPLFILDPTRQEKKTKANESDIRYRRPLV
jgi:hypothetical protein